MLGWFIKQVWGTSAFHDGSLHFRDDRGAQRLAHGPHRVLLYETGHRRGGSLCIFGVGTVPAAEAFVSSYVSDDTLFDFELPFEVELELPLERRRQGIHWSEIPGIIGRQLFPLQRGGVIPLDEREFNALYLELLARLHIATPASPVPVCPVDHCPLRNGSSAVSEELSSRTEQAPLELVLLGGVNKGPVDRFLDLVRKTHRHTKDIREVVMTDPYILSDRDQTGRPGGYDHVVSYLAALGLSSGSKFRLLVTRGSDDPRMAIFEKTIKAVFPEASVRQLKTRLAFHDRLYLVRDKTGGLSGVFGPSLNGLEAKHVVLMGDLAPQSQVLIELAREIDWT